MELGREDEISAESPELVAGGNLLAEMERLGSWEKGETLLCGGDPFQTWRRLRETLTIRFG